MKVKISTHKPKSVVWLVAFLLFIYALIALLLARLPFWDVAVFVSAGLLLLGTTVF